MNSAADLLSPILAGFVSGFLVSMPVGPVNVTVISEALRRGFLRPFLIGLGAVTAEAIYCGLGLTGFQSLLDLPYARSLLVLIGFLVVTILGFRYVLARHADFGDRTALRVEQELEEKLHLHRGYLLGLGMTLGNPFILLVWGTLASFLFAHGLVQPGTPSGLLFVTGMSGGGTTWFLLLAYLTSRKQRNLSPTAQRILTRLSGGFLLAIGGLLGAKLVQAMAASDLFKQFR